MRINLTDAELTMIAACLDRGLFDETWEVEDRFDRADLERLKEKITAVRGDF